MRKCIACKTYQSNVMGQGPADEAYRLDCNVLEWKWQCVKLWYL